MKLRETWTCALSGCNGNLRKAKRSFKNFLSGLNSGYSVPLQELPVIYYFTREWLVLHALAEGNAGGVNQFGIKTALQRWIAEVVRQLQKVSRDLVVKAIQRHKAPLKTLHRWMPNQHYQFVSGTFLERASVDTPSVYFKCKCNLEAK